MNLDNLTCNDILHRNIPLTDLLKDSVYYPASDLDGRPIEYCNTLWRDLDVNSFVYCDFNTKEDVLLALSIHHCMDYAVYDVTDCMMPVTDLVKYIIRPGVMGPRLLMTLISTSLKAQNDGK